MAEKPPNTRSGSNAAARDASGSSVGIVGLGLVGAALARRLRAAGRAVVGFDIDPAKVSALAQDGVAGADSLTALSARCSVFIIAVFDTDQLEAVLLDADGLIATATPASRYINVATADPDRVAALGKFVHGRGLALIEAPFIGSSDAIRAGEATMIVGGDAAHIHALRDQLDQLSPTWHHVGPCGMAARAKLAANLVLGLNRAALAEGLIFAELIGLDQRRFVELLRDSPAYSRVIDTKADRMISGQFMPPQGRLGQHAKDARLITTQAMDRGQFLPLAMRHLALLDEAVSQGDGGMDNSAVIYAIRRLRKPATIGPAKPPPEAIP